VRINVHDNGTDHHLHHGMNLQAPFTLVTASTIRHNAAYGIQVYASNGTTAHDTVIQNTVIAQNGGAVGQGTSWGLYFSSGGNNQAYNTVLYANYGGLNVAASSPNAVIAHTTLVANGPAAGLQLDAGAASPAVRNTLLAQNAFVNNATGGTFQTNLCPTLSSACTLASANPLFVSMVLGELGFLHLQAGSPARDTGTPLPGMLAVVTDQVGVARPQPAGGGWDIGAYEYVEGDAPTVITSTPTAAATYVSPFTTVPQVAGPPASTPRGASAGRRDNRRSQ
jgi:hypothetical protein